MGRRKQKSSYKTSRTKAEVETPATPLHKLPTECHDPFVLVDDEFWLMIMDSLLIENPEAAESLAYLFYVLKEAIRSGPEGVARAYYTLSDGIRTAYGYTDAHQKAFRLYNLYLARRLKVEDEPLQLITATMARAVPEGG